MEASAENITLEAVVAQVNTLTEKTVELEKNLEEVTTQYKGLVSFVNDSFKASNNTLKTIDNLTFMAVVDMTSRGVKFELNPENINIAAEQIKAIVKMFNDYRDKLNEEAEKAEAKAEKDAKKKAKTVAARAVRKGKVVKDVEAN